MDENSNSLNGDRPQAEVPPTSNMFDNLASALRRGADHAQKAADEALPRVKAAAADAAYWTAYGVSFAVMFQWTVAKQITPDSLKNGWKEGLKAGTDAATLWLQKLEARRKAAPPVIPLLGPPNTEQPSS